MDSDRVDAGGPAFLGQRTNRAGEFRSPQNLCGTERLEIIGFTEAPGDGDDLEAALGQQRDRDRAHPAGRAGDDRGSAIRPDAGALERHDGEHCRVAGGADRHGVAPGQPGRERHQPIAFDPRLLGYIPR